jgi:hypothetical protein
MIIAARVSGESGLDCTLPMVPKLEICSFKQMSSYEAPTMTVKTLSPTAHFI